VATKTMPLTPLLLAPTATQFVLPASPKRERVKRERINFCVCVTDIFSLVF
jgi:hypothetical protein